jgi:hypothetical protein
MNKYLKYFFFFVLGFTTLGVVQIVYTRYFVFDFSEQNAAIDFLKENAKTDSIYGEMAMYNFVPYKFDTLASGTIKTTIVISDGSVVDSFWVLYKPEGSKMTPFRYIKR